MLQQKLTSIQNPTASQTCVVTMAPGPTYDALLLNFAGATATLARILNPRLEVNGKAIMSWQGLTLAEVDAENKLHGLDAALTGPPVQCIIHFRRPEVKGAGDKSEINAERATSLRTGDAGTVQFKFEIDAAYVDASAANITAEAIVSPFGNEPMGLMPFVRTLGPYALNAGITTLQEQLVMGGRVRTIHIIRNDITEVSFKRNRLPLIDRASKSLAQLYQDNDSRKADRTADSTRTVIDFTSNGNADEAVDFGGASSLELAITSTAGGATSLVFEGFAYWNEL